MTIKRRVLINKDWQPNDEDSNTLVDFMLTQPHLVDNCLDIITLGAMMKDKDIIKSALYSLSIAAIYSWEMAEEVDLADQLFKKFLGGNNGD